MPETIRKRRRKKKAEPVLLRFWWTGILLMALLVGGGAFLIRPVSSSRLAGYLPSAADLQAEYAKHYGRQLKNPTVLQQWDRANALTAKRDYVAAAAVLEAVSKIAAVPVVFNDLGVLYAELNDRGRCIHAFQEVLARDSAYRPARENLDRLKGFTGDSAAPVSREVEPNDSIGSPNFIALDTPVEASIAGESGDVDTYRITTPLPPRDFLDLEISNRSKTLTPSVRVYDSNLEVTNFGKSAKAPGSPLYLRLPSEPNSVMYVQVLGADQTSGDYSLTARPVHAFDAFEPNDDIFNARPIGLGQAVEANIMDRQDTDYYSFLAKQDGTVSIDIENRSALLIPALTTFSPDQRNSGFGPDIHTPGGNLHHAMNVQAHRVYFVQVWAQADSFGEYTL
jgi:hypothetical protein